MKNEICANCGHERGNHNIEGLMDVLDIHGNRWNYTYCMGSRWIDNPKKYKHGKMSHDCDCKKFIPKPEENHSQPSQSESPEREKVDNSVIGSELKSPDSGTSKSQSRGCGQVMVENKKGTGLKCGEMGFICTDCVPNDGLAETNAPSIQDKIDELEKEIAENRRSFEFDVNNILEPEYRKIVENIKENAENDYSANVEENIEEWRNYNSKFLLRQKSYILNEQELEAKLQAYKDAQKMFNEFVENILDKEIKAIYDINGEDAGAGCCSDMIFRLRKIKKELGLSEEENGK